MSAPGDVLPSLRQGTELHVFSSQLCGHILYRTSRFLNSVMWTYPIQNLSISAKNVENGVNVI